VRFWDSSAVVPLLVEEASTASVSAAFESDAEMLVWWATEIECVSALARLEREGTLSVTSMSEAVDRLAALAAAWSVVDPTDRARQLAIRHLRVHPLRAADALQLAAASVGSEDEPSTLGFVTLDDELATAARREGFGVLEPRPG
jgi:predicted nucleic acid-binding protein